MQSREELLRIIADLQQQLEEKHFQLLELQETMDAIRKGQVDALVTSGPEGERIFSLESTERPYRLMIEQMKQGAGVLDGNGTILYNNHSLGSILKCAPNELSGKSLYDFIAEADREVFWELLSSSTEGNASDELEMLSATGTKVPVDVSLTLMPDDTSTVSLVVTDLSERRHIEKLKASETALRKLTNKLSDEDRRKNEFLATLAHELRNPLASIHSGLELMKLAGDNPDLISKAHLIMERQTRQLVMLVDDLLNISRVTLGKVELRKRVVEMKEIVQSAIESTRPFIDQFEHELRIEYPDAPVYVHGDMVRLAQVFSNLLNNAAKYTPKGGLISISYHENGGEVIVHVKDSGIGIPSDKLDSIFGMFTQLDKHKAGQISGLGIGLTLIKSLVELHDGSVTAFSEGEGQGSEFVVRLKSAARPRPVEKASPIHAKPEAGKLNILIVDDNQDAADTLSMVTSLLGHEIQLAHNGKEAIKLARKFHPDLVLMDIGMPVMDGYHAAQCIRRQDWGKNMSLVALTGWGQEEDKEKAKAAGFNEHLVKPVKSEVLKELLGRYLKKKAGSK